MAGTLASLVLTVEKFELAADANYVPSCSVNPVVNCGSVMTTPQAAVFGFPNSLIGIVGFAVISTIGAALLAGAQFHRWFWIGMQIGVSTAAIFVHWFLVQSLYSINALCPYCMIVWAVTIALFWYVTLTNLVQFAPRQRGKALNGILVYHSVPPTIWMLTVIALITERFWWYWSTLLR
ncbi:vitamin K epoxide reductase family protein [Tsukamurella sp. DT100]|uniref:vitamin K epoxide reductase family protein n=1 Tax=Tsukamurella sp. DT100 TaxID=3393415 RepID=UPI003CEC157B